MGTKSQKQTQSPSTASAILVVMYIAAFVAAFNENIINVALHDIMAAFSVSATTAQWLVSGYMIVTSIFTAIMAFLSGRFSTRKLLFFACGCMVAGEVLCLIAPSFSVLLPSRILQAAGSGILFPLMMNVLHYARAGVWTRDQRSYVHVVWLEGGIRSAAGGRGCGRCGGRKACSECRRAFERHA